MTTQKTFGQIAYEASEEEEEWPWDHLHEGSKAAWERIGAAVAAAHQKRVAAWLLNQPDMCTTDSQAALGEAAQMLMHGEIV